MLKSNQLAKAVTLDPVQVLQVLIDSTSRRCLGLIIDEPRPSQNDPETRQAFIEYACLV